MTTLETVKALQARLDADKENWSVRSALGDAYEDAGDEDMAYTQRWMATHQRCPRINSPSVEFELPWTWWDAGTWWDAATDWTPAGPDDLPSWVFARLTGGVSYSELVSYATRQEAEADLCRALKSLRLEGKL